MTTIARAFSAFTVKSVDATRRTFKGTATTPATDRAGDSVSPLGATFDNPLPLLYMHRHDAPIGLAVLATPTRRGIEFEAEIPRIDEPGPLKDRVDTAWGEVSAGIIRAVSIGFRAIEARANAAGGYDFDQTEIVELSICTIPMNAEATIRRALDAGGPLPTSAVRLISAANQPGVPLARIERPRFYVPG